MQGWRINLKPNTEHGLAEYLKIPECSKFKPRQLLN